MSFNLNCNGSNGRVTISNNPYSNSNGLTEYRGTWQGCNVTFWSYNSGYASIVIYINDYAIDNVEVSSYKLSDFGSVTKAASSAKMSVWNPKSKAVMGFATSATVSP